MRETAGIRPAASGSSLAAHPARGPNVGAAGDAVKKRRQELGLSQAALADLADLTQTAISKLERGTGRPSTPTRLKLAAVLDTDAGALFPEVAEPGGQLQLRARDGGRLLREARVSAGLSQYELAERSGVRQGHISGLEGWDGWNARPGAARSIAAALGKEVDELFEPAPHAIVGGRTQPAADPLEHRGLRAARHYARERGYWLASEAAEAVLKVDERTVHAYAERGILMPVERRVFGGINFAFYDPRLVKEFARSRFSAPDGRVRRFYDSMAVELQSRSRGLDGASSKLAAARAAERRRAHARLRTGKRQPAPNKEHARRWASLFSELAEDLSYDEPTRQEILRQVALQDWQEHPETWPRSDWPPDRKDPESLDRDEYRRAAARIRSALGRLQVS